MAQKKIDVIIDVVVDRANKSLGSFKQSIADADGAAGKFKAGASGAFSSIQSNAGNLAMAGGAALIGFGVKAVGAFQETALEAGKLRDSLGLTAEEASRLIEVSGDLGIDVGKLENSIGKMNVVAERSPQFFADIGAEMAKNADGTTNVQQTFMNVIDSLNKIPNATERASAAQRIFGKDWRTISELIGRGSKELERNLAAVGEGKVMSDEKIASARAFRDKLDELSDTVSDITHQLGGELVPVLTDAASSLLAVKNAAEWVSDSIPGVGTAIGFVTDQVKRSMQPWRYYTDITRLFSDESDNASTSAANLTAIMSANAIQSVENAGKQIALAAAGADLTVTVDDLTSSYEDQINALRRQIEAQEKANEAALEAIDSNLAYRNQVADTAAAIWAGTLIQLDATRSAEEHAQAARDVEGAVLAQAAAAVALQEDQAAANGEVLTAEEKSKIYRDELDKLAANLNGPARDAINLHRLALSQIPKSIETTVTTKYGSLGSADYTQPGFGTAPRPGGWDGNPRTPYPAAAGAIVHASPGGSILRVGEAGHDEAIVPLSGPNAPALGGNTYNIHVSGLTGPQVADQIVSKIKEYERRNGPGWRS